MNNAKSNSEKKQRLYGNRIVAVNIFPFFVRYNTKRKMLVPFFAAGAII